MCPLILKIYLPFGELSSGGHGDQGVCPLCAIYAAVSPRVGHSTMIECLARSTALEFILSIDSCLPFGHLQNDIYGHHNVYHVKI